MHFLQTKFMKYLFSIIILFSITTSFCQTGKLKVIADIYIDIEEVSAIETISGSSLFWVIEDAGNKAEIYSLLLDKF